MPNDDATSRIARWESRLAEAMDELWDNYVDTHDALFDADGTRWLPLGGGLAHGSGSGAPYASEQELADIRLECRALAVENEFAINGHENRINYIVGRGHLYRAAPSRRALSDADPVQTRQWCEQTQDVLDEFLEVNHWHKRQQEIVRRRDRDGEAFLRFFTDSSGLVQVRFVEPDQVKTPDSKSLAHSAGFGIECDARDVESIRGYWIDGQWIGASEIQHRKANVDANVKRGLPLFFPVRKNLRRAEKLLRNMSVVAEIQSAIAIIRKHAGGTHGSIRRFVERQAEASATDPATGRTSRLCRYAPGTILDAAAGTDYQFPAAAIDASRYVLILQAELRAIAARLVMPEFMLTSDASSSNYASTMVAEGPAVRMFERLQRDMIEDDLAVMRRVLRAAVEAGRLQPEAAAHVTIDAVPPSLAVRDRLKEARADEILVRSGAMSVQTMALRHGLDPSAEQRQRHSQASSPAADML